MSTTPPLAAGAMAPYASADLGIAPAALAARRAELAAFLRARRRALKPEDVGLPRSPSRRVVGLRREEVAELAWMSVTWYTWLEQGRDIRTTSQILDSLSRALMLDESGQAHLRRLGGHPLEASQFAIEASDDTPESLRMLTENQGPYPALLLRNNSDVVAWNDATSKVLVDPANIEPRLRNGLLMLLTNEPMRNTLDDWEFHCRRGIAWLRAEIGTRFGDERNAELVELLLERSELFREVWPEHNVERLGSEPYHYYHPEVGQLTTQHILLRPAGWPAYTLLIHQPVDDSTREKLLAVLAG
jgi:MmyB-like transcription regulator ligand binding domain/Helix-turn-helix domain